jgi:hypothetical protein
LYKTYWFAVGKSYKIMKKDKAQASNNQSLGFFQLVAAVQSALRAYLQSFFHRLNSY